MSFLSLLVAVFVGGSQAHAQTLDLKSYLDQVVQKHHGLESLRLYRESSVDKRKAGDIELTPTLTLKGSYLSDKKQPNFFGATESQTNDYSMILAKKFSSGTSLSLSADAAGYRQVGLSNPAFAGFDRYGQGSLGLSFSQSLWKNAFGRSTRLRQEREAEIEASETGGYDLQARQILMEAEMTFWDYLYLKQEVKQMQDSLDRAQRLDQWLSRRERDGISDQADVLSGHALVATRRLQLTNLQDDYTAAVKKIRDFLELAPNQPLPDFQGDLGVMRDPAKMVGSDGKVVSLEAWLAQKQAKTRDVVAREALEAVRSDLSLNGSYNTNSLYLQGGASEATNDWTKTNTPTAAVSLTWTYLFDTDSKDASISNVRKLAMASKLESERKNLESETAWSELLRRHQELSKKVQSSGELSRIQSSRSKAFQTKLNRGRAITTDVVNSEQDAADSELQWTRLQAEQRKLEAQSRLFITVKE